MLALFVPYVLAACGGRFYRHTPTSTLPVRGSPIVVVAAIFVVADSPAHYIGTHQGLGKGGDTGIFALAILATVVEVVFRSDPETLRAPLVAALRGLGSSTFPVNRVVEVLTALLAFWTFHISAVLSTPSDRGCGPL